MYSVSDMRRALRDRYGPKSGRKFGRRFILDVFLEKQAVFVKVKMVQCIQDRKHA